MKTITQTVVKDNTHFGPSNNYLNSYEYQKNAENKETYTKPLDIQFRIFLPTRVQVLFRPDKANYSQYKYNPALTSQITIDKAIVLNQKFSHIQLSHSKCLMYIIVDVDQPKEVAAAEIERSRKAFNDNMRKVKELHLLPWCIIKNKDKPASFQIVWCIYDFNNSNKKLIALYNAIQEKLTALFGGDEKFIKTKISKNPFSDLHKTIFLTEKQDNLDDTWLYPEGLRYTLEEMAEKLHLDKKEITADLINDRKIKAQEKRIKKAGEKITSRNDYIFQTVRHEGYALKPKYKNQYELQLELEKRCELYNWNFPPTCEQMPLPKYDLVAIAKSITRYCFSDAFKIATADFNSSEYKASSEFYNDQQRARSLRTRQTRAEWRRALIDVDLKNGLTQKQIAERFDVDVKTIKRDVQKLKEEKAAETNAAALNIG